MPVLDTPITTDSQNLQRVLGQPLPSLLILHSDDVDKPLDDALTKTAKKYSGDLLVVRVNVKENPDVHTQYDQIATPALVGLTAKGQSVVGTLDYARPSDVRSYAKHLVNGAPLPHQKEKAAPADRPITVTDKTFRKEVLKSKVPVLVDFWADWCGPCHQIAPYIEQIAKDYGGKIKVAKLNIDQNRAMQARYGVQSIPTMIVFEGGEPAARVTGANPVALRKTIERFAN